MKKKKGGGRDKDIGCDEGKDRLSKMMRDNMEMMKKNKRGCRSRNKVAACHKAEAAYNGGVDRLSKLPDDVLVNILERLDTLDAIRTCILSTQLLKLPTKLSLFDIDLASILRHQDLSCGYSIRDIARINDALARVTENFMTERNREIPIRKLSIRFYLRRYDCLSIGKTVAHTMATQKVDKAEFEILMEKAHEECTPADLLYFGKLFNTFLGDCPDAFAGLTRLWLRDARFGERDIPNILKTCKRLKSFRLSHCDAGEESVLQLDHAQLIELQIDYGEFEIAVLNCLPKLQCVTCNNWFSCEDPMSFGSVPQLSELSLTNDATSETKMLQLSQLLANAPSISDLHLDFKSEKIWVLPECPELLEPVLGKLRHVNLLDLPEGCSIAWTMFFLEAAPSLKELCITVWDHWCNMVTDKKLREEHGYCEKANVEWEPTDSDFKHTNLAKLTIYGFQPDDNFMQYIRSVMKAALNIEEITLHDRQVCDRCVDLDPKIKVCPSRYPQTSDEKDSVMQRITKGLELASPAVIHFRS